MKVKVTVNSITTDEGVFLSKIDLISFLLDIHSQAVEEDYSQDAQDVLLSLTKALSKGKQVN